MTKYFLFAECIRFLLVTLDAVNTVSSAFDCDFQWTVSTSQTRQLFGGKKGPFVELFVYQATQDWYNPARAIILNGDFKTLQQAASQGTG